MHIESNEGFLLGGDSETEPSLWMIKGIPNSVDKVVCGSSIEEKRSDQMMSLSVHRAKSTPALDLWFALRMGMI